jgi:photosystem II stability/assembly factor-like uncharacterized protein
MISCLSCNGGTVTAGDDPSMRLLVATLNGVRVFDRWNESVPWKCRRQGLTDFHISSILYEPYSGLVFAGAHGKRGLWMSDDAGETWHPCGRALKNAHIYTLAAQHRGVNVVLYAGTEPAALYRSDDLGRTWRELSGLREVPGTERWSFPPPPHIAHVKNVAFHPAEPTTLYVCIEQGAVLKSVDDGETWVELDSYEAGEDFFERDNHRILPRPSNPRELFMCGGEGLYYSPDGGETWDHRTDRQHRIGYPDAMFIDPRDDNALFMAGPAEPPRDWGRTRRSDATVMHSPDGGRTWRELNKGLPKPVIGNIEAMGMHQFGSRVMLSAGTATGEVFVSDNAGENWTCIARGLPPISKGGHYRWFLAEDARARVEQRMRA